MSPALADANNGNWQTARRWQRMLGARYAARIVRQWPDARASDADRVMLALHARKSAPSAQAWAARQGREGLAVVLTGTDLYRDIHQDAQARNTLALAQVLVTLQGLGPQQLPEPLRPRARVIYQSTTTRQPARRTGRHLTAVMVGHLREEKDPLTLMAAARLLHADPRARVPIRIDHIGDALDPALAAAARATERDCPGYRWLGGLPHEATRRRIQRAHLLVHASRMEGGAHVIMEAVCSGTPVLASRIDGNLGMLGADYPGCFAPGDAQGLAALLRRCADGLAGPADIAADIATDIATDNAAGETLPAQLLRHCAARAALFTPAREQADLLALVGELAHRTQPAS